VVLSVLGVLAVGPGAQASARPAPSAATICNKASAAAVSAIVGYAVPAPSASTFTQKATKKSFGISSVATSCVYGGDTLAQLPKDVVLEYVVTSKPLTASELKQGLAQAKQVDMKFVPYSGLGKRAYYYSFTQPGFTIQGMSVVVGATWYGAAVYVGTTPMSELAALTKLAERL
jgi:hypothetical protein